MHLCLAGGGVWHRRISRRGLLRVDSDPRSVRRLLVRPFHLGRKMIMRKVVHFEIPADDVDRAKKFYGSVFGWELQT
ncbi:MAG TPA: VOC family protein, partial [Propionibacteriaceae bacterium]|nr:VOC family protein [Propionibacteriaceae bacterium]